MLLLSRAYLYMEDNQNALITAEAAIAGAERTSTVCGPMMSMARYGELILPLPIREKSCLSW